jgi:S1-C subfamily serine protease
MTSAEDRPSPATVPTVALRITRGFAGPRAIEVNSTPITVGRGAEATLRFDPHRDIACASGIHARLDHRDGLWWIECLHRSGVRIRARSASDTAARSLGVGQVEPIHLPVEIELGTNGPRFEVASVDGPIPMTVMGPGSFEADQPLLSVPSSVLGQVRRSRRGGRLLSVGAVVAAIAGVAMFWLREPAAVPVSPDPNELATQVLSEMERMQRLDREAFTRVRDSLWRVGWVDSDGEFTMVGSAFAVGRDRLATNAHVADALTPYRETGRTLEARSPTRPDAKLQIGAISVHPAYRTLETLEGGDSTSWRVVGAAADVALLEVVEGDAGSGIPLRGVDAEPVEINEPVVVLGFPGSIAGGSTLQATEGSVSNITDPFLQESADEPLVVHHTASTYFGNSGGPILDEKGRVIAIHSSQATLQQLIPLGVSQGTHVAMLQELLDGEADRIQSDRVDRWRSRFESLHSHWPRVARAIGSSLGIDLAERGDDSDPRSTEVVLVGRGVENGVQHQFEQSAGERLLVVAHLDLNVDWSCADLDLESLDTGASDWKAEPFAWLELAASPSSVEHTIRVWAASMSGKECRVVIRIVPM